MGRRSSQHRVAFEAEALRHLDALYAMALRLTRDERDAEDLVQDSLVKALRFFDRYREGNLKAWLFKVLTNTFYNSIRKSNNIRKLESEAEIGWHFEQFLSSASTSVTATDDIVLDAMASDQLRQAVDELPEDFRTAVLLCDVHGFSYKEIAEIVDCPVGTVMSRLYRARRQLQKRLFDYAKDRGLIAVDDEDAPTDLEEYRRRREREERGR